jgi:hypothetical protein
MIFVYAHPTSQVLLTECVQRAFSGAFDKPTPEIETKPVPQAVEVHSKFALARVNVVPFHSKSILQVGIFVGVCCMSRRVVFGRFPQASSSFVQHLCCTSHGLGCVCGM